MSISPTVGGMYDVLTQIKANETKLVAGTDGNFKIETDISNSEIYFVVTEKLQFNCNAVSAKIVCK